MNMLSQAARKDAAMSGQLNYERIEGDFYPTPPENLDCLVHFLDLSDEVVWEPACGEGHLSKRLSQLCKGVFSTDLFYRGYGKSPVDFLTSEQMPGNNASCATSIVTNPPFGDMAEEFINQALMLTKPHLGKVAMFLRNEYDMACGREHLFEGHPAYVMKVCVTKRPRWIAGSKGSPRHNYSWYVWNWSNEKVPGTGAQVRYIHPKNAAPIVNSESVH